MATNAELQLSRLFRIEKSLRGPTPTIVLTPQSPEASITILGASFIPTLLENKLYIHFPGAENHRKTGVIALALGTMSWTECISVGLLLGISSDWPKIDLSVTGLVSAQDSREVLFLNHRAHMRNDALRVEIGELTFITKRPDTETQGFLVDWDALCTYLAGTTALAPLYYNALKNIKDPPSA